MLVPRSKATKPRALRAGVGIFPVTPVVSLDLLQPPVGASRLHNGERF